MGSAIKCRREKCLERSEKQHQILRDTSESPAERSLRSSSSQFKSRSMLLKIWKGQYRAFKFCDGAGECHHRQALKITLKCSVANRSAWLIEDTSAFHIVIPQNTVLYRSDYMNFSLQRSPVLLSPSLVFCDPLASHCYTHFCNLFFFPHIYDFHSRCVLMSVFPTFYNLPVGLSLTCRYYSHV